jgi:hypothetical protein
LVAFIGSPVRSGGPFLFVYKTCARRPPSFVLKRMDVARGAWTAAPDPPIAALLDHRIRRLRGAAARRLHQLARIYCAENGAKLIACLH